MSAQVHALRQGTESFDDNPPILPENPAKPGGIFGVLGGW